MLNSTAIPHPANMTTFRQTNPQIAAAKSAVTGQAEAIRARYAYLKAAEDIRRGVTAEDAARKWDSATRDTLPADFELYLASNVIVTVQGILDEPAKYEGARCADPLEPDYRDDPRIAIIYPVSRTIYSHAHGGVHYRMEGNTALATFADFEGVPIDTDLTGVPTAPTPAPSDDGLVYFDEGDPSSFPLTPWLVEGLLLYGDITILAGHGAAGKSLLAWLIGLGVATGRAIGPWSAPKKRRNVLVLSGEDDPLEIKKRVVAACLGAGIPRADIQQRFFGLASRDIRLVVKDKLINVATPTALYEKVRNLIVARDVGLIIIDPLIQTNVGMLEIDNGDMQELFKIIRELVEGRDCSILLVDHFNKSGTGDQNSLRGASAKTNASRITVTLTHGTMMSKDAQTAAPAGIPKSNIVHCATPKINYCKRHDGCYFEFVEHDVGNGERRPALRPVAALPPLPPFDIETWTHRQALLDMVTAGRPGTHPRPFSATTSGPKAARLNEALVKANLAPDIPTAQEILEAFENAGILSKVEAPKSHGGTFTAWSANVIKTDVPQ